MGERYVLVLAVLSAQIGCSEYEFKPSDDPAETPDTSEPWPTDTERPPRDTAETEPPPPLDCDEQDVPGHPVSTLKECEREPEIGTFTPIIEWASSVPGDAYTTPAIGNLTDDNFDGLVDTRDVPDVVVGNTAGVTYALSGDTGALLWSAGNAGAEPMSPAIGDLDGDGRPDVVASGPSATYAFRGDTGAVMWQVGGYSGGVTGQCGAVGIHDLDADGFPEVVIGRRIYDGRTGAIVGTCGYGDGSGHGWAAPMGVAADIDQDGIMEVVVGNALYRKDGTAIWYNGQSDGFVAVGQFDADPYGEIVVSHTGTVRLQDDDGTVLWSRPGVAGSTVGAPTIADYDGDGEPEIGIAGNGQYIVLETDGSTKWTRPTQDFSSGFTGSAVFDFESDGQAEVVYADEVSVWVFDGATGSVKLEETNHSSATCSEYPSIADVDGDGHAEIVYTSSAYGGTERGVRVIGDLDNSWAPSRPVWNQHAYAITTVNDDGTIPVNPPASWLEYNNFRSGDSEASLGLVQPDLYAEVVWVCGNECDRDRLLVWVQVTNQGRDNVREVELELYGLVGGAWEILEAATVGPVPFGEALEGQLFEVTVAGRVIEDVKVTIDGGDAGPGAIDECDETNNEHQWREGTCL